MTIVRKWSDQTQAIGERAFLDFSDHEASPATHRIGRVAAQFIQKVYPAMIEQKTRSLRHPTRYAFPGGTVHRCDAFLADRGDSVAKQRCKIDGQTFGQRRSLDRAGIEQGKAGRVDIHDAATRASGIHRRSPSARNGASLVAMSMLRRTR